MARPHRRRRHPSSPKVKMVEMTWVVRASRARIAKRQEAAPSALDQQNRCFFVLPRRWDRSSPVRRELFPPALTPCLTDGCDRRAAHCVGHWPVEGRGRRDFLSLRDPTTRWSGHPVFSEVLKIANGVARHPKLSQLTHNRRVGGCGLLKQTDQRALGPSRSCAPTSLSGQQDLDDRQMTDTCEARMFLA
jgi:hypothetical protein